MHESVVLGAVLGALAILHKPLFLRPLARRRASPWTRWAAQILRTDVYAPKATRAGWALLSAYGAVWGVVFGLADRIRPPLADSYVLSGMVMGVGVFVLTFLVVRSWRDLRRFVDRRLWIGLFLTDILFGATVGLGFLLWGPYSLA